MICRPSEAESTVEIIWAVATSDPSRDGRMVGNGGSGGARWIDRWGWEIGGLGFSNPALARGAGVLR